MEEAEAFAASTLEETGAGGLPKVAYRRRRAIDGAPCPLRPKQERDLCDWPPRNWESKQPMDARVAAFAESVERADNANRCGGGFIPQRTLQ